MVKIGVTADSVNRYRRGARRHARTDVAASIDEVVKQRWQPLVRKRRHRQAVATGGMTVETRVRFGYTTAVGTPTTDASAASPSTCPRRTRNACSTLATTGPATGKCAESSPKDSRISISRTAVVVL
jgi:hypothetical protein